MTVTNLHTNQDLLLKILKESEKSEEVRVEKRNKVHNWKLYLDLIYMVYIWCRFAV